MKFTYLLPLAGMLALAGCQDEKKVEPKKEPPAATAPATPPPAVNPAPATPPKPN